MLKCRRANKHSLISSQAAVTTWYYAVKHAGIFRQKLTVEEPILTKLMAVCQAFTAFTFKLHGLP